MVEDMRYYAPYIAALIVIVFIVAALFHHGSRYTTRSVMYGDPAKEKLIQECVRLNESGESVIFRLYMGSDGAGGACWYSVTVKQGKDKEQQIFASFDHPVVSKINACDSCLQIICGKNKFKIPMDELEQKIIMPHVYYQGEAIRKGDCLSD